MIVLSHVSKHYHRAGETIRALNDVSMEVPAGSLAMVRGPSGSGKTTLINVAAGLTRPTSGEVWCAGLRIDQLSPGRRAAHRAQGVAVVFQMFHLIPYLTAEENVLLPVLAGSSDSSCARERAAALLESLGIAHRAKHLPGELSAGERQRCALGRALLGEPKVILADEPTGNLDEVSAAHVLKALGECRARGATVLLVSHQHVEEVDADMEFRLVEGVLAKV